MLHDAPARRASYQWVMEQLARELMFAPQDLLPTNHASYTISNWSCNDVCG
jgi:hypothetical protein